MKLKAKTLFVLIFLLGIFSRAEACPVCFQSGGQERWAFYATTVLLTFLPLLMVGIGVYFLKKRFQKLAIEQEA